MPIVRVFLVFTSCSVAILIIACEVLSRPIEPKGGIVCDNVGSSRVRVEDLMRRPKQHTGGCFRFEGEVQQRLTESQLVINTQPGVYAWEDH